MKNIKTTIFLGCTLIGLAACQNETLEFTSQDSQLPMSVLARIGSTPVIQARYAGDTPNEAAFATGDAIGIFMDNEDVVRWENKTMGWESDKPVYWPDTDQTHTFQAFYPYVEALTPASISMPSLKTQDGSMTSVAACDFLVATTTQTHGTNGTVIFQGEGKSFKHVSSLVSLFVKPKEDLAGSTLKEITLAGGNIVAPATYSFATGKVSLNPADTESDTLTIRPNRAIGTNETDSIPYYFVLNEKKNSSESPLTLILKYQKGTDNYTAKVENFAANTLAGGNQYLFSLTIKNNKVVISGNTISEWGVGNTLQDIVINSTKDEPAGTEEP